MNPEQLLRTILPDVLIDNFDIVSFAKSADRFDIYLDEKKVQLKEDQYNPEISQPPQNTPQAGIRPL
ncbi:hypothetical protein [Bacteroides acidifaciens]|uniref:hypothetical protein n=1 Tax=Bacteroides acidifaciens TaxID=85831 RepID=UPI0025A554CF|nr:hypothetical protein [Bacteroides acidifaciens]